MFPARRPVPGASLGWYAEAGKVKMDEKPPEPDSMPGVMKDRKPKGVEGQSAIERMSRGERPQERKADGDEKDKAP